MYLQAVDLNSLPKDWKGIYRKLQNKERKILKRNASFQNYLNGATKRKK